MVDSELGIFLCLQRSFDHSRLLQRFDLFACDKLKILFKPFCRVRVATSMLRDPRLEIDGGADVVSSRRSTKNEERKPKA
jgi:hypothetical protein